uniref:Putative caspase n=1 Tax=Xenopsylla cheopis TaxID=163159 RepID=A0A6M2DVN3_XENCH
MKIPETETYFETKHESFYKKCVEMLQRRWTDCITLEGMEVFQPAVFSGQHDLYYNMDNPRRGVALIFNHTEIDEQPRRYGTKYDRDRIVKVFKYLHFEPRVYEDYSRFHIMNVLDYFVEENHTDEDCLVIVVMTHGARDKLYAKDRAYLVDYLLGKFTDHNCPTLAGKPKLIFIQACGGDKVDSDLNNIMNTANYRNPVTPDILVMYSTIPGYLSYRYRSSVRGSWFIQSLCTELEEKAKSHDILEILQFTANRVAVDYEAIKCNVSVQKMPSVISSLTRTLHFGKSNKLLK